MSKRLQVLLDDKELEEIQEAASRDGTTVSDWVRRVLREARKTRLPPNLAERLETLRQASRHRFPAGPVAQMLREIEQGYQAD